MHISQAPNDFTSVTSADSIIKKMFYLYSERKVVRKSCAGKKSLIHLVGYPNDWVCW